MTPSLRRRGFPELRGGLAGKRGSRSAKTAALCRLRRRGPGRDVRDDRTRRPPSEDPLAAAGLVGALETHPIRHGSFAGACAGEEGETDELWKVIEKGGSALMALGRYPFSERYGWLQDRYGLSWQIMFMGERPIGQKITPTLMFVGNVCGKAEEAI